MIIPVPAAPACPSPAGVATVTLMSTTAGDTSSTMALTDFCAPWEDDCAGTWIAAGLAVPDGCVITPAHRATESAGEQPADGRQGKCPPVPAARRPGRGLAGRIGRGRLSGRIRGPARTLPLCACLPVVLVVHRPPASSPHSLIHAPGCATALGMLWTLPPRLL